MPSWLAEPSSPAHLVIAIQAIEDRCFQALPILLMSTSAMMDAPKGSVGLTVLLGRSWFLPHRQRWRLHPLFDLSDEINLVD